MRLAPFAVPLCLLAASSAGAAEPARVAVGAFARDGDVPPAVLERLASGLLAGLAPTLPLVPAGEQAAAVQAKDPTLSTCRKPKCLSRLAALVGARVVVAPGVRSEFESYFLTISAFDASTGELLLERQGACEICTVIEAENATTAAAEGFARDLSPMVAALGQQPEPGPGRPVAISSRPPGAEVRIDGEPVGETDLVVELPPGDYGLEVVLAGHVPVTRSLSLTADGPAPSVLLDLKPQPPLPPPPVPASPAAPPPAPRPPAPDLAAAPDAPQATPGDPFPEEQSPAFDVLGTRVPYATAAFLSLGAGLILLGTGGVLMGLDGEKTCTGPLERCPTLYSTGTAGLVSVITGGAGLLASVTLFVLEQAERGVGIETPPPRPTMPAPSAALGWEPWLDPTGAAGFTLRF